MNKDTDFANILYKLRWSAERGEWSAHLTPAECQAVIDKLTKFSASYLRRIEARELVRVDL